MYPIQAAAAADASITVLVLLPTPICLSSVRLYASSVFFIKRRRARFCAFGGDRQIARLAGSAGDEGVRLSGFARLQRRHLQQGIVEYRVIREGHIHLPVGGNLGESLGRRRVSFEVLQCRGEVERRAAPFAGEMLHAPILQWNDEGKR